MAVLLGAEIIAIINHRPDPRRFSSPSYLMDTPTAIEDVWPSCNTPKKGWFISFDVLDGNKVIGSEDIAFTLTENGIYYVIDGI